MVWTIIGFTAAILTMFGFLPQVIKIYKTKSVKDISLVTLVQFTFGIALWVLYGIYLKNPIIILANAVSLSTLIIALFFYRKYL
jgi:MtN3 and saliva related transmembrane protein